MSHAIKAVELIFIAPWVFIIAVASKDVLREFWMDLRSYETVRK